MFKYWNKKSSSDIEKIRLILNDIVKNNTTIKNDNGFYYWIRLPFGK